MTANVKWERMHDRGGLKRGAEGAVWKGYVLPRKSWGTNGVGRRVEVSVMESRGWAHPLMRGDTVGSLCKEYRGWCLQKIKGCVCRMYRGL